jgi:DUF3017 family protein
VSVRSPRQYGARAHLPFAVVMLIVVAGIVRIVSYHWREGAALIGGALIVAAVLRLLLSDQQAGLLAVRTRPVDFFLYVGFGGLILFVAATITGGPFG